MVRLFLLLVVPTAAFAQSTCYSPSDCVPPQVCSAYKYGAQIDNLPGKCVEEEHSELELEESFSSVSAPLPEPEPVEAPTPIHEPVDQGEIPGEKEADEVAKEQREEGIVEESPSSAESMDAKEEEVAKEKQTFVQSTISAIGNTFNTIGNVVADGVEAIFCLFFC